MIHEIELVDVTKNFEKLPAVENINLKIKKGEFVFLIGKNGSGKSTLLRLISGQITPTVGEIYIKGEELSSIRKSEMPYFRRNFGIMQATHDLIATKTVGENIEFVLRATGKNKNQMKTITQKALSTVGILAKKDVYPNELSAGEKARVLLARAISNNPKILIIDEPTANLSPPVAWDIMCLLRDINKIGITTVITSHDARLVTIMRKRVITLVSGVIVSDMRNGIYDYTKMDKFEEQRVRNERKNSKK